MRRQAGKNGGPPRPKGLRRLNKWEIARESTKSGTTGTLFSEKAFSSPGDRAVVSGDTLTVTYTFSLTAV